MKEYKISTVDLIGFAIICLFVVVVGITIGTSKLIYSQLNQVSHLLPILLGLIIVGGIIQVFVDVWKYTIYTTPYAVGIRSNRNNKELTFDEIEGVRFGGNDRCFVIPKDKAVGGITIRGYLKDRRELVYFLMNHLKNLDVEDAKASEREILDDKKFGINEAERKRTLMGARWMVKILNRATLIVCVWAIIPGKPTGWVLLLLSLMPILALLTVANYQGLVKFVTKGHTVNPYVLPSILFPTIVLWMKLMTRFSTSDSLLPFMLGLFMGILTVYVRIFVSNEVQTVTLRRVWTTLVLFGLMFFHGQSMYSILNERYFQSSPTEYEVVVQEDDTSNHLFSDTWEEIQQSYQFVVSQLPKDRKIDKDTVLIQVKHSAFDLSLYEGKN